MTRLWHHHLVSYSSMVLKLNYGKNIVKPRLNWYRKPDYLSGTRKKHQCYPVGRRMTRPPTLWTGKVYKGHFLSRPSYYLRGSITTKSMCTRPCSFLPSKPFGKISAFSLSITSFRHPSML